MTTFQEHQAQLAKINIEESLGILRQSARGLRVIQDLKAMIDNGGYGLDSRGQSALQNLINHYFSGFSGSVYDALRD